MVLLLVFMQLTRDLFAIAKFLYLIFVINVMTGIGPTGNFVCRFIALCLRKTSAF